MSRPQDIAEMRRQITTLAEFDKLGAPARVGMRFGVDHADALKYRRELEVKAKEEEELSKNKEAERRVKQMQAEITTVEQFRAIGNTDRVAKKYGISKSSAANHLTRLIKEKPKENPAPIKPNSAPSELEGVSECDCTTQAVSVACTPNLNEVEKFHTDVEEPDLSAVTKSKECCMQSNTKPENRFMEVLEPVADLLLRKNANYGNSYHKLREKYGAVSFLIHLSDKFNRLEQLVLHGEPDKVGESVEETIKDIIGYSTLELDFRENGVGNNG